MFSEEQKIVDRLFDAIVFADQIHIDSISTKREFVHIIYKEIREKDRLNRILDHAVNYLDHPDHAGEWDARTTRLIQVISAYRLLDLMLKQNKMISIRLNGDLVQIYPHGPKGFQGKTLEETLLGMI